MYTHRLYLLAPEIIIEPEYNDGVYKHVVFAYVTTKLDDNNQSIGKHVYQSVVYLDDPVPSNFVPSTQVTKELLEQWVTDKLDITTIQNNNISELNK